ncbi:unnamed protein product [Pleuronectes platessa]|uniref:Uncharacterized protein n=1 Tax=Pleuronectes platessa TaxID=8262 RepID=A0A9N7Y4X7_PLEPL|nr:unnamed protein product [Pleuronectes platessa]
MSSQLAPLTLISGGKVGGASDVSKQAGFILTDLGPFLRVICRADDSWLACATPMAPPPAPPPTDPGSACLARRKSLVLHLLALKDLRSLMVSSAAQLLPK